MPQTETQGDRLAEAAHMGTHPLALLLAILNWAGKSRDEEGRLLLESNPLRGLKLPKEKNPARVLLTDAEYEALLKVAEDIDWRFRVALVLAHETGQRIAKGRNPGRKSSKVLQDRTICVSGRSTGPCWIVPRKRENHMWTTGNWRVASECSTPTTSEPLHIERHD